MTDLLTRLAAAPEGGRELDAAIHDAVSWLQYPEEEPPPYTTSLDAALPWENITAVSWQEWTDSSGWCAVHEADGELHIGHGHTEPLARRIAALKAKEPDNG